MKHVFYGTAFALSATMAQADTHYSDLIADLGPSRAAEALAANPNLSASDRFALGGMRFLGTVEGALQTRWQHEIMDDAVTRGLDIPFLRLPIKGAEDPAPFTGAVFERLFTDALTDLEAARAPLTDISDTDAVAVSITASDLWFDINMNARRDPGEDFTTVIGAEFFGMGAETAPTDFTITFDTSDAAWLAAYTHLLAGMSELILSTAPADGIDLTIGGGAGLDSLRGNNALTLGFMSARDLPSLDAVAALIVTLEGQPDASRTQAAHAHFLSAIAQNRVFWSRVATETDNTNEWIPNATQQSALPLAFPPDIGEGWQAVLADAEAVLNGDLLLPHWRLGRAAGLNLAKLMQDPPVIDVIGLFQGYTLLPYAETGPVIDWDSLDAFDDMTGGNSPLFAIMLN